MITVSDYIYIDHNYKSTVYDDYIYINHTYQPITNFSLQNLYDVQIQTME